MSLDMQSMLGPSNKRPRRAAAVAANEAVAGETRATLRVAEVKEMHATKSIALTSEDVLQDTTESDPPEAPI